METRPRGPPVLLWQDSPIGVQFNRGADHGTASAEECSGAITAEEALRAKGARYPAQIANDFAAMERMFGEDLVYIRSVDGASADKRAYIESMRSGAPRVASPSSPVTSSWSLP